MSDTHDEITNAPLVNTEPERTATRALLEQGIASLVEPFIILEPTLEDTVVVDARLIYANESARRVDRADPRWWNAQQVLDPLRSIPSGRERGLVRGHVHVPDRHVC